MDNDKKGLGRSATPFSGPAMSVARTREQERAAGARVEEAIASGEFKMIRSDASSEEFRQQMRDISAIWRARRLACETSRRAGSERDGNVIEFAQGKMKQEGIAARAPSTHRFDDVDMPLAALNSDDETSWTRTDFVLHVAGELLPVFVNEDEDNCVFIEASNVRSDWNGLRIGGHCYWLAPAEGDRAWTGLQGCVIGTLQRVSARTGMGDIIDAQPSQ